MVTSPGPKRGKALLTRVINRVWKAGHYARSQEEFELTRIVLQLLGQRLRHLSGVTFCDLGQASQSDLWKSQPDPLDLACFEAYGCSLVTWGNRNQERKDLLQRELSRAVPDYDPQANKVRRPEAFSGNVYKMPREEKQPLSKPVRQMPREGKAAG